MRTSAWTIALAAAFAGTAASAADQRGSAPSRQVYQQERAACLDGSSSTDQRTCLREAGAALQESRRGGLSEPEQATLDRNLRQRCTYLQGAEREYCERRMSGEGTVSGSVEGGGILRELVVTVPAGEGSSATGSSRAPGSVSTTPGGVSAPPSNPLPSTPLPPR